MMEVKYLMYLWNCFFDKLPDDATLMLTHVGIGTWYEVCFVISFIVF